MGDCEWRFSDAFLCLPRSDFLDLFASTTANGNAAPEFNCLSTGHASIPADIAVAEVSESSCRLRTYGPVNKYGWGSQGVEDFTF